MILIIWGEDKSTKSTVAMTVVDVYPPAAYMEFDIGGFDRAKGRFRQQIKDGKFIREYQFRGMSKPVALDYVMPVQGVSIDPKTIEIRPSKMVVGMKELWYRFYAHFMALLADEKISSIIVDTGTLLWSVCCDGLLQEKQETQCDDRGNLLPGQKLRQQLLEIEYKDANQRMRSLFYQAKARKKNLIVVHHATDEYKNMLVKGELTKAPTGKRKIHGWRQLGDSADMVINVYIKMEKQTAPYQADVMGREIKELPVPHCSVDLCEKLEMVGMEFREPTFEQLEGVLNIFRGEF